MISYQDKKYLYFLKKAIDNDIYLDSFFKFNIHKNINISLSLPKYQKRYTLFSIYGYKYIIIEKFIEVIFPVVIIFIFCIKFLQLSFYIFSKPFKALDNIDDLYFINGKLSYRLFSIYCKSNVTDINKILLIQRHFNEKSVYNKTSVYVNLNFQDLLKIYKIILISIFKFNRKFFNYSFLAVEWLSTLLVLNKFNFKRIHGFDHFDRFAVCTDTVAYFKRFVKVKYIFHQHGNFPDESNFKIPYKNRNIYSAVLFDSENSLKHFNNKISNSLLHDSRILFQTNDLFLTQIHNNNYFKILIIGNSFCLSFHLNIINELRSFEQLQLYYKPHPNDEINTKKYINFKNLYIIHDNIFPKVNLVFSYDSTLLNSYINMNINYIKHNLDETNYKKYATLILNKIHDE